MYLVGEAAFDVHRRRAGAEIVTLKRGELIVSVRGLARVFGWGKSKVSTFLGHLVEAKMLLDTFADSNRTPLGTVYSVVNYDTYNPVENSGADSNGDRSADSNGDADGYTREEVKNVVTASDDKSSGASPVVENSETEKSDELRGEFAQLVRKHLWQSKEPPAKDWTMGREFSIRDRLLAQGESPEIINSVVARYRGDPATMKVYWAKDSRPRWEIDKNECLKSQPARVPKGLPTVGEILSELGGAA